MHCLTKMLVYIIVILAFIVIFLLYSVLTVRFSSPIAVSKSKASLSTTGKRLLDHVRYLTIDIGSRSVGKYEKIEQARHYIQSVIADMGCTSVLQSYEYNGKTFSNVIVTMPGERKPGETVIFGAHYDTIETLDFATMEELLKGLIAVARDLSDTLQ